MTYQVFSLNIRDAGGTTQRPESSTTSFRGAEILADGTNYVAEVAKVTAFRSALDAVHIGLVVGVYRGGNYSVLAPANVKASNSLARRELKWRLVGHDTVDFKQVTNELPCADASLCADGSDYMDQALQEFTDLKAAYDAFHHSNSNRPAALDYVELVGRNL